jgi:hypothetical protein
MKSASESDHAPVPESVIGDESRALGGPWK